MTTDTSAFSLAIRVYYEDTDAGGVVYHANYLKFLERARTEWLRHLGFEQDTLACEENLLFVVRHIDIDYLKPALFNDRLITTVNIEKRQRSYFQISQSILRHNTITGERDIVSKAKVTIVAVSADHFKPKKIPDIICTAIENLA
ncbi:MAG: tol-pal system-associated acyl-CoA thioesterase [Cocleimonas sp.]|nr:tol-pal system-associated acyl-CoA thioesterase [Cocleimonas sp.]